MRVALGILNVVLAVLYPLAVWWSLSHYSTRTTGLVVLAILVPIVGLRVVRADRSHLWPVLRLPLTVMALLAIGVVTDHALYILAMPVLINAALFVAFATSLRGEMPIVERFARMQDPDITPAKQRHCRQATVAWCVFFVLNGGVAGALAVLAPVSWWATYTGGIAYALMGGMFAFEYVIRKARFREYGRLPHDLLLKRLFPPEGHS